MTAPAVFQIPTAVTLIEGAQTLGLQIRNISELIQHLEQGLKPAVARRLAEHVRVPLTTLYKDLDVAARTITKAKKDRTPLSRDKSETLYRAARIFERTLRLFHGDEAKAAHWMITPKFGLGGATPLQYARTEPGGESVLELLEELLDGGVA